MSRRLFAEQDRIGRVSVLDHGQNSVQRFFARGFATRRQVFDHIQEALAALPRLGPEHPDAGRRPALRRGRRRRRLINRGLVQRLRRRLFGRVDRLQGGVAPRERLGRCSVRRRLDNVTELAAPPASFGTVSFRPVEVVPAQQRFDGRQHDLSPRMPEGNQPSDRPCQPPVSQKANLSASAAAQGDRHTVGHEGRQIGQTEHVDDHDPGPLQRVRLATDHAEGGQALGREDVPSEEG